MSFAPQPDSTNSIRAHSGDAAWPQNIGGIPYAPSHAQPPPMLPVALPTLPPRFRKPQLLEVLEASGSIVLVASDDAAGGRPVSIKAVPRAFVREEHEAVSREVMNSHIISRWGADGIMHDGDMERDERSGLWWGNC